MSKKLTTSEFEARLKQFYGEQFTLLSEYEGRDKKITLKCNKCGNIIHKRPGKMTGAEREGCYICSGKNKFKTTEFFQQEVNKKYPNTYVLLGSYTNARTPLLVRRLQCGHEYMISPDNLLRGKGCPKCSMRHSSYMKKVEAYLDSNGIIYEKEKVFDDCRNIRPLPFDYYIPSQNICIEVDGEFHFDWNSVYKAINKHCLYQNIHARDTIKTQYCATHGIKLIRIPYFQIVNLAQILDAELQVNTEITSQIQKVVEHCNA